MPLLTGFLLLKKKNKKTLFNNSLKMKRQMEYLWKAKRGEFDRAVNACLKMVDKANRKKSW
jgi:hypothetical protein